ncbi:hypothetical protein BZJ19_12525 [Salinivibrio proteolyticus]|uniref:TauD/TfdA family dioxygenase n=1 Tax=Salinivibrio proteolyticus TaxID=334715 RepID=UPI000988F451|nr:TauD/TfdA family dioxygenase [Salinivibrio proteolyticus]OOF23803.1 hypothetical protein BZJ19_12525 [Salinivibrio proteolyticus]
MIKYTITPQESEVLSSKFLKMSHKPVSKDSIEEARQHIVSSLPDLSVMKEELSFGSGMVKFESLPIDSDLPPPPVDGKRPKDKSYYSEHLLCGITSALGMCVFSYQNEKDGALVHEIAPIPSLESSKSSNGRDEFMFHTDGAYLDRESRPHTLSLMCLVNEGNVATDISSLQACLNDLTEQDINILTERLFMHRAPETFNVQSGICQSSVLDKINGFYEIKVATHSTQGITPQADNALKKLISAMYKHKTVSSWKSGDLVVFNNLRTVHGRGEVKGNRWLQRCYGSSFHDNAQVIGL